MTTTKFMAAINQICDEKNVSKEKVLDIINSGLSAAYKKDYGTKDQEVEAQIDPETGEAKVFVIKEVVLEVEDENIQINLADAKKLKKDVKVGETVKIDSTPPDYGRIAAQTAKQVIIQRIREAERDVIFSEYKDKEGTLLNGVVQRVENNNALIDLGKATAIMFPSEQIPGEKYYPGQRIRVYIVSVDETSKGPQVVVSRSHPEFLRRLFELEVPEIPAGTVEVKSISREAGERSKVAVMSTQESVDPVGSCVGQRGMRVQAIISELGREKIDIILWDEDPAKFIAAALSPAKVTEVKINKKDNEAKVKVPEDQLSLAIGKSGQNVRLAAKLTGWKVDIEGAGIAATEEIVPKEDTKEESAKKEPEDKKAEKEEPKEKEAAKKEVKDKKDKENISKDDKPKVEKDKK